MALNDLLKLSPGRKLGLSKERLEPIIPVMRKYVAFWREYPDMFVDFLQTGRDPTRERRLKFYFY